MIEVVVLCVVCVYCYRPKGILLLSVRQLPHPFFFGKNAGVLCDFWMGWGDYCRLFYTLKGGWGGGGGAGGEGGGEGSTTLFYEGER